MNELHASEDRLYNLPVHNRIYHGSRDLWLPGLVITIGWALSFIGWRLLVDDREVQLLEATRDVASATEEAVTNSLSLQMHSLHGLSKMWSRFGLRPLPEWQADANLMIDTRVGLTSVAWVDLDEEQRRIAVGEDLGASDLDLDLDEADARSYYPNQAFVGPEPDRRGGLSYRVILPVRTGMNRDGMLVARVRIDDLLTPLFEAHTTGYAVSIFWDDQIVFARGVAAAKPSLDWWQTERVISLPISGEWRIVHRPTSELAWQRLSRLPDYLFGAAILLSVLLATVIHQWRVVSRQARFLAAANRTLEERGQGLEALNLELERRVAERTDLLEEAVAELEAFNYSVSHDLRSPLGAVLNFAAILEEDYRDRTLDQEGIRLLRRIEGAARRATNLLEGLLEISRAGRAPLDVRRVDMKELARQSFVQSKAAQGEEKVEFVLGELFPVAGDEALLGAVFTNLFTNALKYSRGCEKRTIRVTGTVNEDECTFEVEDNGQGFDMRFESKLFALFERLHGDDDIEGTGLGLALVARIIKRHGGRVWAHGEVGKGACFSFALPREITKE